MFVIVHFCVFFCDGAGADGCEGMNIISVLHPSCHVPRLTLLRRNHSMSGVLCMVHYLEAAANNIAVVAAMMQMSVH